MDQTNYYTATESEAVVLVNTSQNANQFLIREVWTVNHFPDMSSSQPHYQCLLVHMIIKTTAQTCLISYWRTLTGLSR